MTKSKIPVRVYLPISFKEVDLKKVSIKEIIRENDGKLVLIIDEHYSLREERLLTRIRYDPNDKQCYYAQLPMPDRTLKNLRLNYDDLHQLFIEISHLNSVYGDFEEELYLNPIEEQIAELQRAELLRNENITPNKKSK